MCLLVAPRVTPPDRQRKVWAPKDRLFEDHDGDVCEEELKAAEKEGHSFLAHRAMQAGRDEEALRALEKVDSPTAAFEQAKVGGLCLCTSVDNCGLEELTLGGR